MNVKLLVHHVTSRKKSYKEHVEIGKPNFRTLYRINFEYHATVLLNIRLFWAVIPSRLIHRYYLQIYTV
jgi:hypothetical protein